MEITGSFVIDNPVFVFGLQRTPNIGRYEEMNGVFASCAFATQGVFLEPNTNVLMLQPVPLQSHTTKDKWTFNTVAEGAADTSTKWREVPDPTTGLKSMEMPDATAGRTFYGFSRFDLVPSAGFYLNIYRGEASRDALRSPVDYYTQIVFGDGQAGALRLTFAYGMPPIMELCTSMSDSGTPGWSEVARAGDAIPDCAAYIAGLSDGTLRLMVMPLASEGAVIVTIGQNDAALVFRLDGADIPAGPLTIFGQNGVVRVQYQPMRFVPLGGAISAVQDHGTTLVNPPQSQVNAAQSDQASCTCEVQVLNGTMSQYALTLDATATMDDSKLATQTPLVRSVDIFFPGVTYNSFVEHRRYMNMKRVENESLTFDLSTLTYSQSAEIVCDNHDAQWTQASGYRAGYLEAGIDGDNWRRITGWVVGINQKRNDPVRETRFRLVGKEYWLQRRCVGPMGPLDGYDIYAAIRTLAQKGGITDEFLQALPYTLPGRGQPSDYYHLPEGTGNTGSLFQFSPQTKIWDAMQQIARKVRGYLGFDVFGFLRFYRWSAAYLGGYMQAFDVIPYEFDGVPLYNQLKNSFEVRVDLSDVRSDITLGAIDPFTFQPIFAHGHNESVVTDISNPAFIGNDDPYIEINPMLFDPDMQNMTMAALEDQASLPGLTVYLDAYLQHRVVPLDVITVREEYALGGLYPFYVTGMNSSYGIDREGHFGQTQIAGRWLMNG